MRIRGEQQGTADFRRATYFYSYSYINRLLLSYTFNKNLNFVYSHFFYLLMVYLSF